VEIDLREIQALHARYARESVVIDLENQIRAMPAPLLLSHRPPASPTTLRRVCNARWQIGRVSLMVVAGTTVCAALGMGAARLWPTMHASPTAQFTAQTAAPASPLLAVEATAPAPARVVPPLTTQALDGSSHGASGLAAIDPAALIRDTQRSVVIDPTPAQRAATTTDEQKAIASPIHQRVTVRGTAPAQPSHVAAPAPESNAQPEPRRVVHHLTRLRQVEPMPDQPTQDNPAKSSTTPARRNGDVQLF
jgi:hypothetical protein